jgi:hypothetical protein
MNSDYMKLKLNELSLLKGGPLNFPKIRSHHYFFQKKRNIRFVYLVMGQLNNKTLVGDLTMRVPFMKE